MTHTLDEIKVMCAEEMGWKWKEKKWERSFGRGGLDRCDDIPNYPRDPAAALTLVEAAAAEGWTPELKFMRSRGKWFVILAHGRDAWSEMDSSLPIAISLAYLRLKGRIE